MKERRFTEISIHFPNVQFLWKCGTICTLASSNIQDITRGAHQKPSDNINSVCYTCSFSVEVVCFIDWSLLHRKSYITPTLVCLHNHKTQLIACDGVKMYIKLPWLHRADAARLTEAAAYHSTQCIFTDDFCRPVPKSHFQMA